MVITANRPNVERGAVPTGWTVAAVDLKSSGFLYSVYAWVVGAGP